jgi:hypothetical protein
MTVARLYKGFEQAFVAFSKAQIKATGQLEAEVKRQFAAEAIGYAVGINPVKSGAMKAGYVLSGRPVSSRRQALLQLNAIKPRQRLSIGNVAKRVSKKYPRGFRYPELIFRKRQAKKDGVMGGSKSTPAGIRRMTTEHLRAEGPRLIKLAVKRLLDRRASRYSGRV